MLAVFKDLFVDDSCNGSVGGPGCLLYDVIVNGCDWPKPWLLSVGDLSVDVFCLSSAADGELLVELSVFV